MAGFIVYATTRLDTIKRLCFNCAVGGNTAQSLKGAKMTTSSTFILTEVTYEANLLCYHDLEEGGVCLFEGEVEYTITLKDGVPYGVPAEANCPECGGGAADDGVVDDYLNNLE